MNGHVRVNLVVEGQTEETFVLVSLSPYLALRGIYAVARSVETSRKGGKIHRGGLSDYAKPKRDVERWLKQDPTAFVSTMFDLYGLPHEFPGYATAAREVDPLNRVRLLEQELENDVRNQRFVPYIQLHEFEALLFSSPEAIDADLGLFTGSRLQQIRTIRSEFASPEHIDDGEETAPSKRLKHHYPAYDKPATGPRIIQRIGVDVLRQNCRHFDEWLARLERIAGPMANNP